MNKKDFEQLKDFLMIKNIYNNEEENAEKYSKIIDVIKNNVKVTGKIEGQKIT